MSPESQDTQWIADWNDIELEEIIGRGNFGEVWKGKWRGQTVAVLYLVNYI